MKRAATVLFVCSIAACLAGIGGAAPAKVESDSIRKLKQEKLKVAEEWLQMFKNRQQSGVEIVDEEFKVATAIKDAQLDLAESKQERIKALSEYRDRMKAIYEKADVLRNQGGQSLAVVPEARIGLLNAEINLKEEEAK
jgi:hypothetical protein